MEENDQLLKYIYHEDLYIIAEPETTSISQLEKGEGGASSDKEPAHSLVEEIRQVVFFGDNKRKILIIVNDPENEFLNQKELRFLMSIIEAGLKYSKNDFALVNNAVFSQEEILKEIPYDFLISFGQKVDAFDSDYAQYQIFERSNKKMLYAEKLSTIEADKQKKGLFWKALKKMFNI